MIFDGLDPAEGGWSLKIVDHFGGPAGVLKKARISFLDKNISNEDEEQMDRSPEETLFYYLINLL